MNVRELEGMGIGGNAKKIIIELSDERDRLLEQRDELLEAAIAVVQRWDTPNWKDVPATAEYISQLRAAITKAKAKGVHHEI